LIISVKMNTITHYQREAHKFLSDAVHEAKMEIQELYREMLDQDVDVSIEVWPKSLKK